MYEIDVNSDELQSLQDAFCKSAKVYLKCLSKKHGAVTSFSGTKLEESFAEQFFTPALEQEFKDSFFDGSVEDVIEKNAEQPYIMVRGVAIRGISDEILGIWLCMAVDEKLIPEDTFIPSEIKRTSSLAFDEALSLLTDLTKYCLTEKQKGSDLLEKLSEEQDSVRMLEHRLMKNEIMTEILRMMESENSFSKISEDILRESGQYIGSSHVVLLKLAPDEVTVDMIAEWCHGGADSLISHSQEMDIKNLPFMNGKPYTISSDSALPESFAKYFSDNGIEAGIFLPIEINGQAGMYLCFLSIGARRKWSVDDIRFANDIKRIIHTILIKRITKNSLASSYSALESILQRAGCGVAVIDPARRQTLYENDTFKAMFENEIDRLAIEEIIFETEEDLKNITGYSANGAGKWYSINYSNMTWVDGRQVRLNTFFDVSELKQYQKKMERQANLDTLTGIYNRQCFEHELEAQLHFVEKTEKKLAVVLIDLNDFSNLNEGLGHTKGDSLLKYIAKTINGISVISDKCYRVGGDEFAIIVSHDIYDKLEFIIKRVSNLFENPWVIENEKFECSMSMGILRLPQDGKSIDEIQRRLAATLSVAKDKGKNYVEFYDSSIDALKEQLAAEENIYKLAVENNLKAFEVYYQPIFEIKEDENICCGAEALVRFNHEKNGFMEACDFIDTLETTGLIIPIGEKVLNEACKACKHWNDFGHPGYRININLSYTQLIKSDIKLALSNALTMSSVEPDNVIIEVSEEIPAEESEKVFEILKDLKALGVRLALDNFGTGSSSFKLLNSVPVDTIKIDGSFVREIKNNSFSKALVGSAAELGSGLDIDICAQGIEKNEQLDIVKNFKVRVAQGNYFDKPMPLKDFEKKYI